MSNADDLTDALRRYEEVVGEYVQVNQQIHDGLPPARRRRFWWLPLLLIVVLVATVPAAVFVGRNHFSPPLPAGQQSCPPLPAHPTAACTGVPAGTVLTDLPVDGDSVYTVNTDNTVLDSVHIPGTLVINAENVTIKNSMIDQGIYNGQGDNSTAHAFTVTDTTIGPDDTQALAYPDACIGFPGITAGSYTATRVEVRNHDNGFQLAFPGRNATVIDSFARICAQTAANKPPDGSHSDGFQAYCPPNGATPQPCGKVTLTHNTFEILSDLTTAPVFGNDSVSNGYAAGGFDLTDSLVIGGVYSIYVGWQGGPNVNITNNSAVTASPGFKTWFFGPATSVGTCAHQNWSGNNTVTIDSNYVTTSVVSSLSCMP